MQMEDTQLVPAPRAQVWAALNNPEILKACIPGCESLTMTSPTEMIATVVVKVGPVKAKFSGKVPHCPTSIRRTDTASRGKDQAASPASPRAGRPSS